MHYQEYDLMKQMEKNTKRNTKLQGKYRRSQYDVYQKLMKGQEKL